jgi:hypothetical protein
VAGQFFFQPFFVVVHEAEGQEVILQLTDLLGTGDELFEFLLDLLGCQFHLLVSELSGIR